MLSVCGLCFLSTPLVLSAFIDNAYSLALVPHINIHVRRLLIVVASFLNNFMLMAFALGIGIVGLIMIVVAWSLMFRRRYIAWRSPNPGA